MKLCSIPALHTEEGWIKDAQGKADSFRGHFCTKFTPPELYNNEYSKVKEWPHYQDALTLPGEADADAHLKNLDENGATGPDDIPARILKWYRAILKVPVTRLALRIIACGQWPNIWRLHHLVPLHKRLARHAITNYCARKPGPHRAEPAPKSSKGEELNNLLMSLYKSGALRDVLQQHAGKHARSSMAAGAPLPQTKQPAANLPPGWATAKPKKLQETQTQKKEKETVAILAQVPFLVKPRQQAAS